MEDILLIHNVPFFAVRTFSTQGIDHHFHSYLLKTASVPPDLQVLSIAELVICEPLYSHNVFGDRSRIYITLRSYVENCNN